MSINNTNPQTLFGGTWEQLQNRFLLGAGSSYNAGATGGESSHTLTINEMPSHNHETTQHLLKKSVTASSSAHVTGWDDNYDTVMYTARTGGDQAHNNMPPYLVVYMWKRTA